MPTLPVLSGDDLIKLLEKIGFHRVRQVGSHVFLERTESNANEVGSLKTLRTTVPLHDTIGLGLLKKIMKDTEVSLQDLLRIMNWK